MAQTTTRKKNNRLIFTTVMVLVAVVLVSVLYFTTNAQTVTPSPSSVTTAKPETVTLQIKTKEGAPDTATAEKVKKVKVGTETVTATPAGQGSVTFPPPPNLAGNQIVHLLDETGKVVPGDGGSALTAQLNYGSATVTPNPTASPSPTVSPTPDMAWIERFNAEARRNDVVSRWWYYPLVIIGFLGLSGAFAFVIVKGILFSRATFRTATGLPVGSFRAILAYTLVLFLGFYVLISLLVVSNFPPPEFLLGIVATVIGFYFGTRSGEEGAIDTRLGIVRGIVRKDSNPVSGATVKFKIDGKEPYTRISDVDGRFDVRVAKGKYKVVAEVKTPPATGEQDIDVDEGSDHEIEIAIKEGGGTTPPPPPAQTGTVVGVVKDADGKFPTGATVELSQAGAKKGGADVDPTTGQYKVPGVKPGKYDIEAKAGSTSSGKQPVEVTAGRETKQDLTVK